MFDDEEITDSVERDHGVFIARHLREDPDARQLPEDREDKEGRDINLGEDRDPELWGQQRTLIEEDVENRVNLVDFPEGSIPRIIDAMGDEVAEPLQGAPNGVSATGSGSEPEHGGFPEQE